MSVSHTYSKMPTVWCDCLSENLYRLVDVLSYNMFVSEKCKLLWWSRCEVFMLKVVNQSLPDIMRTHVNGAALSLFDVGVNDDFQTVSLYHGNIKETL